MVVPAPDGSRYKTRLPDQTRWEAKRLFWNQFKTKKILIWGEASSILSTAS